MVKIMENPIKMDDLEENPLFSETSTYFQQLIGVVQYPQCFTRFL